MHISCWLNIWNNFVVCARVCKSNTKLFLLFFSESLLRNPKKKSEKKTNSYLLWSLYPAAEGIQYVFWINRLFYLLITLFFLLLLSLNKNRIASKKNQIYTFAWNCFRIKSKNQCFLQCARAIEQKKRTCNNRNKKIREKRITYYFFLILKQKRKGINYLHRKVKPKHNTIRT